MTTNVCYYCWLLPNDNGGWKLAQTSLQSRPLMPEPSVNKLLAKPKYLRNQIDLQFELLLKELFLEELFLKEPFSQRITSQSIYQQPEHLT
jgi:hypothetical protein